MPPAPAFAAVARLPAAQDNVAIAIRRLDAGERITLSDGAHHQLAHTVLEGHRFAVRAIRAGEALLSWGMPFGVARSEIAPGDYVCNQSMLDALAVRRIDGIALPALPNFADNPASFRLDAAAFQPAAPTPPSDAPPSTFLGYRRSGTRGVGTRNTLVILGTSSQTASFARQLASRLQPLARVHPTLDGIVAIAHTEGGGPAEPNNTPEILRTLAGFMVHPNVGAVLAIDYGTEPITNARVAAFMRERNYPLADVPHAFLTIKSGLAAALAEGERIVREWLPIVSAQQRSPEPLSDLRIALQCGGSDAFSGVSGNPLAGAIVHEVVARGGTGVLTETDEAVGGEAYLLKNVRDLATAQAFLGKIDSFRERLNWHGVTPESNPSAGNKFRGLYNIALKSLGAVHKKDPRTRLDYVIDYAAPLSAPGFYFMNGPGNDLEGIAGQVGAGCNLILFVTGNGSITNFPFVPTLKITTTTRRHQLLIHEMDINAGRYLDGEAMDSLTTESLQLVIETASGRKTKGEHAGHSQVSLWRNWRQTDTSRLAEIRARPAPDGKPLPLAPHTSLDPVALRVSAGTDGRCATERIGLVLPTSLCSAQIARLAADRLNASRIGADQGISRFVALAHTEGCGFGGESMYRLLERTYRGYITHPNVAAALLLEHGCEKLPNDVMRRQLESAGIPLTRFGWASVQLDGGIAKALDKIEAWFVEKLSSLPPTPRVTANLGALTLGLMTRTTPSSAAMGALLVLAEQIIGGGGSVLVPEADPLLANPFFARALLGRAAPHATLIYGQPVTQPGFHIIRSETDHWAENLTGMGGCGAHLALTLVRGHAEQGHPMLPVIQFAEATDRGVVPADDIDAFATDKADTTLIALQDLLVRVAEGDYTPAANAQGFVDFQLTRGLLGVTT